MPRALKTYPALAAVRMPRGAAIVAVHPRGNRDQPPALLVEFNPDEQEIVERQFIVLALAPTVTLPERAGYVHSWRVPDPWGKPGEIVALYERFDADVPADRHPDAHGDYRVLLGEGYLPFVRADGIPCWKAPDDVPAGAMSREAMEAVARLQEHGYGSVVA
jgi:hypothetical protein